MPYGNNCSCKKQFTLNMDLPIVVHPVDLPIVVPPTVVSPIDPPIIVPPTVVPPIDPPIIVESLIYPIPPIPTSGKVNTEDVHTLIIYAANTYESGSKLPGVKEDQRQLLAKISGITGQIVNKIDPSTESNKMRVLRYPNEFGKTRIAICFDNNKSTLINNLKALVKKYTEYSNVIFTFSGHGGNGTNINDLSTNEGDEINLKTIIELVEGKALNVHCYLDCCRSGAITPHSSKIMTLHPKRRYLIMTAGWRTNPAYDSRDGGYLMREVTANINILSATNADSLFIFTCLIGRNMVEKHLDSKHKTYIKHILPLRLSIENCKLVEHNKTISITNMWNQSHENVKTGWSGTLSDWLQCIRSYKYYKNKMDMFKKENIKVFNLFKSMSTHINNICHELPRIYLNDAASARLQTSKVKNAYTQLIGEILCNASNRLESSLEGSMSTVVALG